MAVQSRSPATGLPVVLGLALAFTVTVVDPLMLSLNLPQISRALQVPPHVLGVLGGAATLVVAAAVLAVGSLGDAFGLKRLLMAGLVGNVVVNVLAALSPSYGFLLAMRLLDGLVLAALVGVSLALLKVSVPEDRRPQAIGFFMATEMLLCGVMPAVGGWVAEAVGWRWLFLVAPLMSLSALGLTARYVREPDAEQRRRLDLVGVCLVGLALLALVHGMAEAQNGFSRPQAWLPLVLSAATVALFVLHERRSAHPALNLTDTCHADHVVVTLPLGVLQSGAVTFGPGLPAAKRTAIDKLGMGVLNKCYLRFPKVFWPDTDWMTYVPGVDKYGQWEQWINITRPTGHPVLLGFNAADFGRTIEGWSDTRIIDSAMGTLRTLFGRDIPAPVGHQITRWASDPYARGSYSYNKIGSTPVMRDHLAAGVDERVHFAGEATHRDSYQTVHGAYLSGIRAAKEVAG
ncbi:MFS transporter [Streptomyces lydicus]|uniref:MFS transporter n=1 Tax=Streptomyces lydicus TaxID=47763 RepID=UPI0036E5D39F